MSQNIDEDSRSGGVREILRSVTYGALVTGGALLAVAFVVVFGLMIGFHDRDVQTTNQNLFAQYQQTCENGEEGTRGETLECLTRKYDAQVTYAGETAGVAQYGFLMNNKSATCEIVSYNDLSVRCTDGTYPPFSGEYKTLLDSQKDLT